MISSFFIKRPVLTYVVSIFILIAGAASIFNLPVEQFPEITPPEIQIEASYPGASAETIEQTVASPIEQQINGIENMLYMKSSSFSNGSFSMSVTFESGTNIDQAEINISNRIKRIEPLLPEEVRRNGITVEKRSSSIVLIAVLESNNPSFDAVELSNYASINIVDELKRVKGVGKVTILGARDYSMRVWLKPDMLSHYDLTLNDVTNSLREQNAEYAVGKIGQAPTSHNVDFTLSVTSEGRLKTEEEFSNIVLKANPDGSAIRLKDVARIELGSADYETSGKFNRKPTTLIAVYPQPNANMIAISDNVHKRMQQMKQSFPSGITYSIPYDTTKFVRISIEEVVITLLEAIALVFLVVYLFMQNWRATLIPCLAVPVSIIGTFAGLYLMGYSVNTLTLFALVLAIGIVVDDAIVVLENVERIMHDKKIDAMTASFEAMQEVTGPVISIVLVLCAVFIPVTFLTGLTGELYRQFAVTVCIAVIISGIVALTLTPVLCSIILSNEHKQSNILFTKFNLFFDRLSNGITSIVALLMKHGRIALVLYIAIIATTYALFNLAPKSFIPSEDQGFVVAAIKLPEGASISRTEEVVDHVTQMIMSHPSVENVVSFSGLDIFSGGTKPSAAVAWVILKDWSTRKHGSQSSFDIAKFVNFKGMSVKEAQVMCFSPPSIPGMGITGGFEFYVQNRSNNGLEYLAQNLQTLAKLGAESKQIAFLRPSLATNIEQYYLQFDREKALALGIPVSSAFKTLSSTFSSYYVNDFNKFGRTYRVILQADSEYRSYPSDISKIFVRSVDKNIIPMSAIASFEKTTGPEIIDRFNGFTASAVFGEAKPGYSTGQAMESVVDAMQKLPKDLSVAWVGESYQQMVAGSTSGIAFIFGIIMIFLILSAQYEKWSLPFAIILAVPFGVFGAFAAVLLRGISNDIYFQIGLITLIALTAKNAILIVEFADIRKKAGSSNYTAALEALKLRFRPIIMTSLAFILGVLPLVFSTGAGSYSRHSIGTGVFGGMVAATVITLIFVPIFFYWILERKLSYKPDSTSDSKE
ncbi:MAG: efflux RND transporter permease subunit [Alphaproteobacteria bacterium]